MTNCLCWIKNFNYPNFDNGFIFYLLKLYLPTNTFFICNVLHEKIFKILTQILKVRKQFIYFIFYGIFLEILLKILSVLNLQDKPKLLLFLNHYQLGQF